MTKTEVIKIFFIALITGNIMGVILLQIFHTATMENFIILEISLIIVILMLFIASKVWKKRLEDIKNIKGETKTDKE